MNHTKLASCLTDLALAAILLFIGYAFFSAAVVIAGSR